jgi:hypothetical protein
MSGKKIIDGLNDALEGRFTTRTLQVNLASYPTPEEVVQSVLMEGLEEGNRAKVSAPVRRKAQRITNALRRYGWRILR